MEGIGENGVRELDWVFEGVRWGVVLEVEVRLRENEICFCVFDYGLEFVEWLLCEYCRFFV